MANRYDWGIPSGVSGIPWDKKDKERNVYNQILNMLNRSLLMFEYHGLPESLPAHELERLLQTNGYAGVTTVNDKLYAFYGGLGGEPDVYGKPTTLVVSNPALKYNATLTIGEDVVLMKNDSMMQGLMPTFSKYTTMLNENEITMTLASISKRVNNLISVADDNTAESARKYLKQLEQGEIGYIFESKLFESLKTNPMNASNSVNISELIELQQYLKATLYNEIGLNANYNMKRERLNTSEVEMNSDNLYPLVDNMLENRRIALDKINEKFGTDITVEFNSSWNYRVNQGEDVSEEDLEQFDEDNPPDNDSNFGEGTEKTPQPEDEQTNRTDDTNPEDDKTPDNEVDDTENSDTYYEYNEDEDKDKVKDEDIEEEE